MLAAPVAALGHGAYGARAKQPAVERSPLRLAGVGGYATERRHAAVRVTVCLSKRFNGRFVAVRCETATDVGRKVRARVSVPGCVAGAWRTEVVGQALGRDGTWTHDASDASAIFRCG